MSEETPTLHCPHCDQDIVVTKAIEIASKYLKTHSPEEFHKNCPSKNEIK
jgi:hypothetical protein